MSNPEPPEEEGNRNVENAVMLGFFVVLVAAGVLAARHHGRRPQGAGLCSARSAQLRDARNSGAFALEWFL